MKTSEALIWRRLAFASPEVSITLLFASVNSWFFYYLVNICGIPAVWAGFAFALGRGVDACVDPFIGRWIDRRAVEWGRKAYVRLALGPAALAFLLSWVLPAIVPGIAWKTLCAGLAFCAFTCLYSMATVARMSMLPEYEQSGTGRIGQVGADMALVFVSLMVAVAGLPALVAALDGAAELSGTRPEAWTAGAAIMAAVAVVTFLPFLLWVPDQRGARVEQVSLRTGISGFLGTPGSRSIILAFVCSVLALSIVQSILPFFLETVARVPKAEQAPVLAVVFGTAILSLPLWVMLGRWFGKVRGYLCGLAAFGVFLGLVALMEKAAGVSPFLMIAGVFAGAAIGALNLFPWSILPDLSDRCRISTGRPQAAFCAAIFMFANQMAGGVGVALNGLLLSWAGHVPGQQEQTAQVETVIVCVMAAIPAALAGGSALALFSLARIWNDGEAPSAKMM